MVSKYLSRFDHLMPWIILGLVVLVLCFGLLVPIYSDEVAIHMSKARFFLERGQLVTLFPQCETSSTTRVPVTWYPAAILYGFVYALPGGLGRGAEQRARLVEALQLHLADYFRMQNGKIFSGH